MMLRIILHKLAPYMKQDVPGVEAGFRKHQGTSDRAAEVRWMRKRKEDRKEARGRFID